MPAFAQANSKAWARKLSPFANADLRNGRPSRTGRRELDPVIRQDRVYLVGHGCDQVPEEVARDTGSGLLVQLDEGELGRAVDGDEQVEPALLGAHLGDVDVKEADRVGLEAGAPGPVAVDLRQPGDAVPLETAVQA